MPRKRKRDQDGLYRRKDSPYWWASWVDGSGNPARRSTGTTDKAEAKVIRAKWELEAHKERKQNRPRNETQAYTFHGLMMAYMQSIGLEKRSVDRDRYSLKRLYPFFAGKHLSSLSAADIRSYVDRRRQQGVQPATINRELGLLSAALNWARDELEWDVPNPVRGRKPKSPAGRVRWITRSEAEALIRAAKAEPKCEHVADFIRLGLHTGMRKGEMLGPEWRRVDLREGLVYLEAHHQKNGQISGVPLNRDAREAILSRASFRAEHCPRSPWVFAHANGERIVNIKKGFAGACRRMGLEDFHPHDLRHTSAAWMVQDGVPIRTVAEYLRHADIRMTMRYAHLSPANVRAAAKVLEGDVSRSSFTLPEADGKGGDEPTITG